MFFHTQNAQTSLFLLIAFTLQDVNTKTLKNPCLDEADGSFVRDPYACERFFQCRNGTPLSVHCPEGMYFDPKTRICDISSNVYCEPEDEDDDDDDEDEKFNCPEPENSNKIIFIASQINCNRYYICYHGVPVRQECVRELHWNSKTNKCDFPENAKCTAGKLPKCPEDGTKVLPHPTICGYFYYCVRGMALLQQCPFYHHWDIQTRRCQWKNRARCWLNENTSFKKKV